MRIIIVDDHTLLRSGLAAVAKLESDIEVVGEASNGLEAIELFRQTRPDIAVMDVTMPVMGGLEASSSILEEFPDAKILVMTQHEEQSFLDAILELDIAGCIGKRAAGEEFVSALRAVERGEFYLHPALARIALRSQRRNVVEPWETLTPREREILQEIVAGKKNAQIARDLYLSAKTVEWHRSNLMSKLDTHSVAELVSYAISHNLAQDRGAEPIDRL